MNDVLTPGWIKEIEAENARNAAQQEAAAQSLLVASMTIDSDSPEYWRHLVKELAINTDALPKIGLAGQTYIIPNRHNENEQHCRIEVSQPGALIPRFTHTDLFYSLGTGAIRCHPLNGESMKFSFCLLPRKNGIGVTQDGHSGPIKNAEQLAESIVRRMAEIVQKH